MNLQNYLLIAIFISFFIVIIESNPPDCPICHDDTKYCLLRSSYYSECHWMYWTGYNCHRYTDPHRYKQNYKFQIAGQVCTSLDTTSTIPYINDTIIAPFNISNTRTLHFLKSQFKTSGFYNMFLQCWMEAIDCCENHMDGENILPTEEYCPVVWDGWSCFPRSKTNQIVKLPCTAQAYQSPESVCELESEKRCFFNSTRQKAQWDDDTNYNVCAIAPVYKKRHEYHVISLYVSTFLALPAIVIFLAFAKFRKITRIILHRNLLIAISIRNIFTIMSKTIVIIDGLKSSALSHHVMVNNGVACRVLAFFESASKNAIYASMLVDGFYLHKCIVRTFADEPKLPYLYIVVGVLSVNPTLIWSIILGVNKRENCWLVDVDGEQWAVDSFRIAILSINTLLLFDIIRVMVTKMNKGSTSRQTKATFRATLFLIPLFGIHIAVTAKKIVVDDSCTSEDIYDYARYTMEALQGIFVAILFCYTNSEVHYELQNAYRKFRINQKYDDRRATAATFVAGRLSRN